MIEDILGVVPQLPWLRLMYAYPQHITPRLIETMAAHPQVCHYLDLPLQHAHPATLHRMCRSPDVAGVQRLIAELRQAMPDIALRTAFIVGYPGETEEEFVALLDFMANVAFDRVGIFIYSPEEGTAAAVLPDPVPRTVAEERYARAMNLQRGISLARNQMQVGRTLDVLVEGTEAELSVGRSYRDAPEIDGYVLLSGQWPVGQLVKASIERALEYDLARASDRAVKEIMMQDTLRQLACSLYPESFFLCALCALRGESYRTLRSLASIWATRACSASQNSGWRCAFSSATVLPCCSTQV